MALLPFSCWGSNKNDLPNQGFQKYIPKEVIVGTGTLMLFPQAVQTDKNGSTPLFNLAALLTIKSPVHLTEEITLVPSLGATIPRSTRDGENITLWNFYTNLLGQYRPYENWYFTFGLGWFFTHINGSGGVQELNNGVLTESFYLPNGSTTSYNFTTNLGTQYALNKMWYVNLETSIFNLLDNESRDLSITLTIERLFSWQD